MKYISLCSGIEAASQAFIPLGWTPIAFSEIEPFPCAVLKHKYPNVPNHGDLSKYDWGEYRGKADLVCAGFPCQAFSIAGLRGSLEDCRGNLSIIGIRAIHTIRPRWVLLEQVPGVLSAEGNAFGCILAGLSGADAPLVPGTEDGKWRSAGIVSGPGYGLAWRILNAEFFGVPQRRERIFIIGYLGDWRRAAQVLFEPHGVPGYSAESCEAGQATAGEAADSAGADSKPLAFKIRQGKFGGGSKGYLGSEDKAFTVATGNDQNIMTVRWQNKNDGLVQDDKSATLKSSGTTTDERSVGAYVYHFSVHQNASGEIQTSEHGFTVGTTSNASARNTGKIMENDSIRRLTPGECSKLQGFPAEYTAIPYKGKVAEQCPDGPRYKAIGNSWAVPCARWIGERIQNIENELSK